MCRSRRKFRRVLLRVVYHLPMRKIWENGLVLSHTLFSISLQSELISCYDSDFVINIVL